MRLLPTLYGNLSRSLPSTKIGYIVSKLRLYHRCALSLQHNSIFAPAFGLLPAIGALTGTTVMNWIMMRYPIGCQNQSRTKMSIKMSHILIA